MLPAVADVCNRVFVKMFWREEEVDPNPMYKLFYANFFILKIFQRSFYMNTYKFFFYKSYMRFHGLTINYAL